MHEPFFYGIRPDEKTVKRHQCAQCTAILSLSGHRSGNKASNFVALSLNESVSNFTTIVKDGKL